MPESAFQQRFHARRGYLRNAHVRDLAWLLDSPDLLDAASPQWHGRIATLFGHEGTEIDEWLRQLDAQPGELQALIARHGFNRLGRYSELLMGFFFTHVGALQAHGLQVRAATGETVGEFDFLLRDPASRLLHWEFATKYYLLESGEATYQADALVGPNLADTLGAKMRKILERQLSLSQHPAAQAVLTEMPALAQALIKGWLFYAPGAAPLPDMLGVNPAHCRGFWLPLSSFDEVAHDQFLILPRLRWLAPARAVLAECLGRDALSQALERHFSADSMPVMIALMRPDEGAALEIERGFIVPDDWKGRARQFVRQ
ncbi:MAG TPA: DUF1853 family protein [Burkholderiaceae bacterium]